MQRAIGYALLVVALAILGVGLLRLRRSGYRPQEGTSLNPLFLTGAGFSLAAAIVLFAS